MSGIILPPSFVEAWKAWVANPIKKDRPILDLSEFFCTHDLLQFNPYYLPDVQQMHFVAGNKQANAVLQAYHVSRPIWVTSETASDVSVSPIIPSSIDLFADVYDESSDQICKPCWISR